MREISSALSNMPARSGSRGPRVLLCAPTVSHRVHTQRPRRALLRGSCTVHERLQCVAVPLAVPAPVETRCHAVSEDTRKEAGVSTHNVPAKAEVLTGESGDSMSSSSSCAADESV